MITAVYHC